MRLDRGIITRALTDGTDHESSTIGLAALWPDYAVHGDASGLERACLLSRHQWPAAALDVRRDWRRLGGGKDRSASRSGALAGLPGIYLAAVQLVLYSPACRGGTTGVSSSRLLLGANLAKASMRSKTAQ